ncbi:MAG: MFS transporter [Candidatus Eremiobacteraeota bacterium]|nr:MFS transporter [Candidatus Eremiobacteraeota bacterium]
MSIAQRLDDLGTGRHLVRLVARVSLGGWFEFYDLFMTAYIALGLFRDRLFAPAGGGIGAFATFIGAGFAGMFVGTLVFGWISDRFGRRSTFGWSLLFYSIATVAMALAPSALSIDILRFLAGLGIGVQTITIDAYISELVPPKTRGRYIALSQAFSYTAVPVVALLCSLLVPAAFGGISGWRWVALFGGAGALFVRPLQRGMPESPRWLEARGRHAEAQAAVAQLEAAAGGAAISATSDVAQRMPSGVQAGSWRQIWSGPYRGRTLTLLAFNFFQTIGFYGFASWVPVLLFAQGVTFVHSLQYTFLIALASPLGPLVAMALGDAAQRKWQLVGLALGIAVLGSVFARMRDPAAIVGVGVAITLGNNWFSCAFHAYQAELYPTAIRGRAIGFVYSFSRLSAVFVGFWIAATLARYGIKGVFGLIAAAMAAAAAVIGIFGPITNRRSLEALAP